MDDLLGELLRAANPAPDSEGALPARATGELKRYRRLESNATGRAPKREIHELRRSPRGEPLRFLAVAAGAIVAIATALVLAIINPAPVAALTPPLLHTSPVLDSASDLLSDLAELRRHSSDLSTWPNSPVLLRIRSWSLNTSMGENGEVVSSTTESNSRARVFAAVTPGSRTLEHTDQDNLPSNSDDVGPFLIEITGEPELTAGEALQEITTILTAGPVTAAQESALLEYLARHPELKVAGVVSDRLGRRGIAFAARDRMPEDLIDLMIVSTETGEYLGSETVFVGAGRSDITAPAVVEYVLREQLSPPRGLGPSSDWITR